MKFINIVLIISILLNIVFIFSKIKTMLSKESHNTSSLPYGKVIPYSEEEAFKELLYLAENGDIAQQYKIGDMYLDGKGISKDINKAIYWYKKSASQGNVDSQNALGVIYTFYGEFKDVKESIIWYEKAANQGFSAAQFNLANIYKNENEKSFELYKKSANQSNKFSQHQLGKMYAQGIGVKVDMKKAKFWTYKAHIHGVPGAKNVWEEYKLWEY